MATKKALKSVVVAPQKGVVVGNWRERATQSITESMAVTAKLPQSSGNKLSFKGGVITLAGNRLDNPLPLVILAFGKERTYYSTAYQPDVFTTPDCYSLDGDKPAENAKVPQADKCAKCRLNEFESAPNGKGKACKEGAVFAAIHADALKSPEKIATAQIVTGSPSVLNTKHFSAYMAALLPNGACWSVITMLGNEPDSRTQYALSFEGAVFAHNDDIMNALAGRLDEAKREITKGYTPQEEVAKPKAGVPARRKKF
jgi:hypothetical protein